MGWHKVSDERWERHDGAVVMLDLRSPYPNPMNPRSLLWTAWEPDPSDRALSQRCSRRFKRPRRWGSAEAAMLAVEREFPVGRTAR